MQLEHGRRLGPYEIVEPVGAGGMGEVYRARDTRLSRSVAIKVLPADVAQDARLRARLEREAKAISALNHPHICTLHDIGRENGIDYLVLEYCEGQTLAQRLERGALSIDQSLQYGIEIADALGKAHRAGVIHRDLKPSNIILTKSGVKLLDFGLAKQRRNEDANPASDTASLDGALVGTIAYMAPEVLAGAEADARSDIFALGLLLYEMLTGRPAFAGTSKATVMASILEREPKPLRELEPRTPPALEHVIQKTLAKNPDERWESAHDVAEELRWIRESGPAAVISSKRLGSLVSIAITVALAGVIAIWSLWREPKSGPLARLSIPLPMGKEAARGWWAIDGGISNVAISRDGRRIAYSWAVDGVRRIYMRQLDAAEAVPLAGSEGGVGPFFSPDGQSIGFSTGILKKIDTAGGPAQQLSKDQVGTGRGAAWAEDGTIYFSPTSNGGIWKTTAAGTPAVRVTEPNRSAGENSHRWPHLLPDGKHLLFTIRTDRITSFDEARIAVLSLETGKWKVILEGGANARYATSGHLLFGRDGALYAVPFDLKSMAVTGPRRKVIDGVLTQPNTGAAHYSVSETGDLVYLRGGAYKPRTDMLAVDRTGQSRLVTAVPFSVEQFRLSPDGRKIALSSSAANDDIFLYDIATGGLARFTFEGGDEAAPVWTVDSASIIYLSLGRETILMRRADGGGEVKELLTEVATPHACSPDGSLLAYTRRDDVTGADLWVLALHGDRKPRPLLQTPFLESVPSFSPTGEWIAYSSNQSGVHEAYVRATTPGGGQWQVSAGGGGAPRWSADGREVFYRRRDDSFFAVRLSFHGTTVQPEKPQLLFSMPDVWAYDVTKEGFLLARNATQIPPIQEVQVVLNWSQELR